MSWNFKIPYEISDEVKTFVAIAVSAVVMTALTHVLLYSCTKLDTHNKQTVKERKVTTTHKDTINKNTLDYLEWNRMRTNQR